MLIQDDEHATTYMLDPTLRWIYFSILLAWGVAIATESTIAFVVAGVATVAYFTLVWWPSRSIRSQIQTAARGGWIEIKGSALSRSNPATFRISKIGLAKSGDA